MSNTTQDPTPSEIAQHCAEIQRGWTPDERRKRLRADWRPMVKAADDRLETMTSGDYDHHLQKGYDACHENGPAASDAASVVPTLESQELAPIHLAG